MRLPNVRLFSSKPQQSNTTRVETEADRSPVGAGIAEAIDYQYASHSHLIKWVQETKEKLPNATYSIRLEAFLADPLLSGTICPYLQNTLLQGFSIQTKDNQFYSAAIEEIEEYIELIDLIEVFREDFPDLAILVGHSYRRMDPGVLRTINENGNIKKEVIISKLERVEPSSVVTYHDPWNSSVAAYHQHALINKAWSASSSVTQVDSWFIPFGNEIDDIYSTYSIGESEQDPGVYSLFEKYKENYSITNTQNLRIASSERIIAMHNSKRNQRTYINKAGTNQEIENPAPIDSVLLSIWLKRLLLVNSPNLIYMVLSPFVHMTSGIMREVSDSNGNNKRLESSLPKKPSQALQKVDPDKYNVELANFNAYFEDTKKAMKNIITNLKNGGVYSSGPDVGLKTIESSKSISFALIQGLIKLLNGEIGQAFGFPMALMDATGTELASSRQITQMFNSVHAGDRRRYERQANKIIQKRFAGKTWEGTTSKNGKEVKEEYKFEDIKAKFKLDVPDTKDLLAEAQTTNSKADTLNKVKAVGASRDDLIALGQEYGFGLLGLDNYQNSNTSQNESDPIPDPAQVNAILKSILDDVLQEFEEEEDNEEKIISTEQKEHKEPQMKRIFKSIYEKAKIRIDNILGGT